MIFNAAVLTGNFTSFDEDFASVPAFTADQSAHFLRREALAAWLEMHNAAANRNINLCIISSLRSFERQKSIWENKWNGITQVAGKNLALVIQNLKERARVILRYSAMPGTSRHHWGTDFDINALEDDYFLTGRGKDEYAWLNENAAQFGFAQPYTGKGLLRANGYEEEKWHWSYVPLSREFLKNYLQLIDYSQVTGFQGSETAEELKVIEHYVNGIAESCK